MSTQKGEGPEYRSEPPAGQSTAPGAGGVPNPYLVFISYRRKGEGGHAQRLFERLDRDVVFKDTICLQPGEDFLDEVRNAIRQSAVVLVVISDTWLTVTDAEGGRRLDNQADVVRLEIATALSGSRVGTPRGERVVIPVLVGGAKMPEAADLPDDLKALSLCHASELRDSSIKADTRALIRQIETYLPPEQGAAWAAIKQALWLAAVAAAVLCVQRLVAPLSSVDNVWAAAGVGLLGLACVPGLSSSRRARATLHQVWARLARARSRPRCSALCLRSAGEIALQLLLIASLALGYYLLRPVAVSAEERPFCPSGSYTEHAFNHTTDERQHLEQQGGCWTPRRTYQRVRIRTGWSDPGGLSLRIRVDRGRISSLVTKQERAGTSLPAPVSATQSLAELLSNGAGTGDVAVTVESVFSQDEPVRLYAEMVYDNQPDVGFFTDWTTASIH